MRPNRIGLVLLICASMTVIMGADRNREKNLSQEGNPGERLQVADRAPNTGPISPVLRPASPDDGLEAAAASAAPLFNLDWYSVNGGGETEVTSASYGMGASVGQSAAGFASGTDYQLGIGFWYGAAAGGGACPIAMTGDVNLSGSLTSADIIALVNYVFKGMAPPLPCEAAGDVNCSSAVTSADIIYMVNHVFKGMAAPCDVCTLIPGMWTCP